jgi:ABC-type glucose/galactose transport system permease subunit
MRRLLRLPVDGPRTSLAGANEAFTRSIALSATRCLLTYVLIPLVGLAGTSGSVGPIVGLCLGAASTTAITFSLRRFFGADHKWRWYYAGAAAVILVLVAIQSVVDVAHLVG